MITFFVARQTFHGSFVPADAPVVYQFQDAQLVQELCERFGPKSTNYLIGRRSSDGSFAGYVEGNERIGFRFPEVFGMVS